MTLSRPQLDRLRRALDARRGTLIEELKRDAAKARDEQYAELAGTAPDAGDESVADLIADLDMAELSRDLQELREIDAALDRMSAGTYGWCASCGEQIAPERLHAAPAALRCVACQGVHEKTHAGGAPSKL